MKSRSALRRATLVGGLCAVSAAACDGMPLDAVVSRHEDGDTTIVTLGPRARSPNMRLTLRASVIPRDSDGTSIAEIGEVEIASLDTIGVFDRACACLLQLDSLGTVRRRIGRLGNGPSEFRFNVGMALKRSGELAQWDLRNARVTTFTADGTQRSAIPVQAGHVAFNALYVDGTDRLLVRRLDGRAPSGAMAQVLVRLDERGESDDTVRPPALHVSAPRYVVGSSSGGTSATSRFAPRAAWEYHRDGFFVSANGETGEVFLTQSNGRPLRIVVGGPEVQLSENERTLDRELVTWRLRQEVADWRWSGPDVPARAPRILRVVTHTHGLIWIQTPGRLVDGATTTSFGREPPDPELLRTSIWMAFSRDGESGPVVELSPGEVVIDGSATTLWTLSPDADGLLSLRRYVMRVRT